MLSAKQHQAITALLKAGNLGVAAQQAGVSEATLRRWRQQPAFQHALDTVWREQQLLTQRTLAQAMTEGLAVLRNLALRDSTPPAVRAQAAVALVRFALQAFEQHAFEDRLQAVEESVRDVTNQQTPPA